MSTRSIGQYYTAELFHYLEFYHNCKRCGFPFASFLEAPARVPQLLEAFDRVYEQIRAYQTKPGPEPRLAPGYTPRRRVPARRR